MLFPQSYYGVAYLIASVLFLPSLISKVVFQSTLFSSKTAFSFLYFPIIYLIGYGLAYFLKIDLPELLLYLSYINVSIFNLLLLINLLEEKVEKGTLAYLVIPVIFSIIFLLFRDRDSVVALDYLQHLTVTNRMDLTTTLCLLPGDCSNLFLQHGYTTFYHTILGFMTRFTNQSATSFFYILDLIYPIFIGSMVYALALKHIKKIGLALIAAIVAVFTFNNGSYDSVLFLPQSFAFILFLNFLFEEKLKTTTLILAILLMISSHFILGVFFSVLLIAKTIFSNLKKAQQIFAVKVATVTLIFFFLANLGGLSIEKLLQFQQLDSLGGATNSYFPYNLLDIFNVLGLLWIPVLAGILRLKNKESRAFYILLVLSLIAYLFAPTYANKFLIGIGIYGALIFLPLLEKINFTKLSTYYLGLFITLIALTNYITGFDRYLSFYKLDTEQTSAVTQMDLNLARDIQSKKIDCLIISDPLTQINLAALANRDTLFGQYMNLQARENLYSLVNSPNNRNLSGLAEQAKELGSQSICIVNTPRLQSSIIREDNGWTAYLYNNPTDATFLPINENLSTFMKENGFTEVLSNETYTLWQKTL